MNYGVAILFYICIEVILSQRSTSSKYLCGLGGLLITRGDVAEGS